MKNSYKFFSNKECEYYPCHNDFKGDFNCLFCYCPFYLWEECLGNPKFIEHNGKKIKDCSFCKLPHIAENYDMIIETIMKRAKE